MTLVENKFELKQQRDRFVVVEQNDTMYELHDGEYIAKLYFRISDIMNILGKTRTQVYWLLRKHGIKLPVNIKYGRIKIPLTQLRQMADEA
jgi:hypothetical protein